MGLAAAISTARRLGGAFAFWAGARFVRPFALALAGAQCLRHFAWYARIPAAIFARWAAPIVLRGMLFYIHASEIKSDQKITGFFQSHISYYIYPFKYLIFDIYMRYSMYSMIWYALLSKYVVFGTYVIFDIYMRYV